MRRVFEVSLLFESSKYLRNLCGLCFQALSLIGVTGRFSFWYLRKMFGSYFIACCNTLPSFLHVLEGRSQGTFVEVLHRYPILFSNFDFLFIFPQYLGKYFAINHLDIIQVGKWDWFVHLYSSDGSFFSKGQMTWMSAWYKMSHCWSFHRIYTYSFTYYSQIYCTPHAIFKPVIPRSFDTSLSHSTTL